MPGRPGPAKGSIRLTQEHRDKIAKSKVLTRLIGHAEGTTEMKQSEVTAAIALLKKYLPDEVYNTHGGDSDNPIGTVSKVVWVVED